MQEEQDRQAKDNKQENNLLMRQLKRKREKVDERDKIFFQEE
jgi:hypothetical protein